MIIKSKRRCYYWDAIELAFAVLSLETQTLSILDDTEVDEFDALFTSADAEINDDQDTAVYMMTPSYFQSLVSGLDYHPYLCDVTDLS